MLDELTGPAKTSLRPLYEGYVSWQPVLESVFEGYGQAFADDADSPAIGLLRFGHDYFAAGAAAQAAVDAVMEMLPPQCTLVVAPEWNAPVEAGFGSRVRPVARTAFAGASFDRKRLTGLMKALPRGHTVRRITISNFRVFAAIDASLVRSFGGRDAFLARGVGFGVERDGHMLSGCSSFAVGGGKLEVEVDTLPAFRRKGFAAACAATLILHCLDNNIAPCWDAMNAESVALGTKLGFSGARPYTAYFVS